MGQQILALRELSASCMAFSPDGRRLAVGCEDGTVKVSDAATGQALSE
jgi:WD40 repeat protein